MHDVDTLKDLPSSSSSLYKIGTASLITGALLVTLSRRRRKKKLPMNAQRSRFRTLTRHDSMRRNVTVRVLSAFEIWGPNHASHRMPWKAPRRVTSFVFRVNQESTAPSKLLFIADGTAKPARLSDTMYSRDEWPVATANMCLPCSSQAIFPRIVDCEASPVAQVPPASTADCVDRAGELLGSGAYHEALECLAPLLAEAHPSEDACVLASAAWWNIAEDQNLPDAYRSSADVMMRILERDQTRRDIWYRVGSCRLQQAAGESGSTRRRSLEEATWALRRALPDYEAAEMAQQLALADALLQYAMDDSDNAAHETRLGEVADILRAAAMASKHPASLATMKLQRVLQLQARSAPRARAVSLRSQASAILSAGLGAASEPHKTTWLIEKVENELALADLAEGASRAIQLRMVRETYLDVMTGSEATPELLFSWLELLALETAHLRGPSLHFRLDEAEEVLSRLEETLPGSQHVAYIRSMLLKRRAIASTGGSRARALSDALQCLAPFVDRGDLPALRLEAAELTLLYAASQSSHIEAGEKFKHAEDLASPLVEHPTLAMRAVRCLVEARVGLSPEPIEEALYNRLLDLAPHDSRSRWLLANAALRSGRADTACSHCEAAVASLNGALPDRALQQLWDDAKLQRRSGLPSADARHIKH